MITSRHLNYKNYILLLHLPSDSNWLYDNWIEWLKENKYQSTTIPDWEIND